MEQSDNLSITLKLGTRVLPMTIRRSDEIFYREAEKLINNRFNYYASRYPSQGNELYLTMMALDVAVRLMRMEQECDPQPMVDALGSLLAEVEATLV